MAKNDSESLFRRLTLLFRSGPVIKRKVRDFESGSKTSSAFELFRKTQSHVYSTAMSAYGTYDRMARYSDFSEMEYTPEISSAIDIYAEETVSADEIGTVLHIHSENPTIQRLLEEVFYDTLNVEFNLTSWVRTLCKYGDFFLFNDVSPEHGVINGYPIPVNEIEREEGFDPNDPMAVRYRWVTQGNQVLENWQVTHMRVLGNDAFLPYGSSVLESARRIWRQLILIEDAMLVYRIVRSPERRVFYVDVGNVPPEEIPNYMEQVQTTLKRAQVVDRDSGRVDLRYNPLSVDEDYYLPVRGSETGTKIDTLAGGQNTTAIEDVEYIQKKLFAALKIPKAYLGYDEGLGAKATLSQEDIRFSRTIARIQRTVIAELNKIAIIHLFCNGFEGEDLLDFKLQLSNPSTIAQQQKLELFRSRFEIAGNAMNVAGMVNKDWLRKNLFSMTDSEIDKINKGLVEDKTRELEIESIQLPGMGEEDLGAEDLGGGGGPPPGPPSPEPPPDSEPPLTAVDIRASSSDGLISDVDIRKKEGSSGFSLLSIENEDSPIVAQNRVDKFLSLSESAIDEEAEDDDKDDDSEPTELERSILNRRRKRHSGGRFADATKRTHTSRANDSISNPDGMKLLSQEMKSDMKALVNPMGEGAFESGYDVSEFLDEKITQNAKMNSQIRSTLKSLGNNLSNTGILMSEGNLDSIDEA